MGAEFTVSLISKWCYFSNQNLHLLYNTSIWSDLHSQANLQLQTLTVAGVVTFMNRLKIG